MKQPPPSTPFSTPLSGSARQAEARIRNLFSVRKSVRLSPSSFLPPCSSSPAAGWSPAGASPPTPWW